MQAFGEPGKTDCWRSAKAYASLRMLLASNVSLRPYTLYGLSKAPRAVFSNLKQKLLCHVTSAGMRLNYMRQRLLS